MADSSSVIGLLEDDPDQARLLCHWLEEEGFTSRLYPSAVEFRRRLGAESVDLLVLDWNLPDESGLDVLHWLRDAGHARLPVLFLTGYETASWTLGADVSAQLFVRILREMQKKGATMAVPRPSRRSAAPRSS